MKFYLKKNKLRDGINIKQKIIIDWMLWINWLNYYLNNELNLVQ